MTTEPHFEPGWLQEQVARSVAAMNALPEGLRRVIRGPQESQDAAPDDPYEGYGPCFCLGCIGGGTCEHAGEPS